MSREHFTDEHPRDGTVTDGEEDEEATNSEYRQPADGADVNSSLVLQVEVETEDEGTDGHTDGREEEKRPASHALDDECGDVSEDDNDDSNNDSLDVGI